jgi:hypothetical protein
MNKGQEQSLTRLGGVGLSEEEETGVLKVSDFLDKLASAAPSPFSAGGGHDERGCDERGRDESGPERGEGGGGGNGERLSRHAAPAAGANEANAAGTEASCSKVGMDVGSSSKVVPDVGFEFPNVGMMKRGRMEEEASRVSASRMRV